MSQGFSIFTPVPLFDRVENVCLFFLQIGTNEARFIIDVICYMIVHVDHAPYDLYYHARPFAPSTRPTHLFYRRA